jgi:glycine/D-amino acid oxidase-like deaminating enzyme
MKSGVLERLKGVFFHPSYAVLPPTPEGDWRPRFLPDPDFKTQWGKEGELLSRLIRSGVRVPPLACFGVGQIGLWQAPENRDLKPGLSPKTLETLRQMLCGGLTWKLKAWSSPGALTRSPAFEFASNDESGFESAVLKIRESALGFGPSAILVSPELHPDQEGYVSVVRTPSGELEGYRSESELHPNKQLREYWSVASKLGIDLKMHWIWDGEQLWIDRVSSID